VEARVDMNDRALRNIVIGLGGTLNGVPRQDGFLITAASEVMAIFAWPATAPTSSAPRQHHPRLYAGQPAIRAADLGAAAP
jgi:hypothetical protein